MVQIIQSQPTQRQSALEQALGQAVNNFGNSYLQGQQTLRQQALQDRADQKEELRNKMIFEQKAAENGMGISYEDAKAKAEGTYQPKVITPGQDAIPAQYGKEVQGPVMPGQDPLREVFSRAKEAVPAVMGPSSPYQPLIEAKKAEKERKAQKELLDSQNTELSIQQKRDEILNNEEMNPIKKRQALALLEETYSKIAKNNKESTGKQLNASDVLKVEEGNQIPKMLQDIKGIIASNKSEFGPISGRVSSMNPYNEKVQTMESQIRTASQMFGKYMEGGVLRPDDEAKYRKMFPNLSDTPEVAANKLAIVEKILIEKQNSAIDALKNSGYDTSGVNKGLVPSKSPNILGINQEDGAAIVKQAGSPWLKYGGS